jgi:GH25 family lysozyme M1 (1,4-beta-N-acetylmuramidase)
VKGIDVSKYNGTIDWQKVKKSGIEFAILKAINKQGAKEESFERNYSGAVAQSLPVDAYNYSYATTTEKAVCDAEATLKVCSGKKINTIWLDVEDICQYNLGMTLIDLINAYKKTVEKAGFKCGVYTGLSFYNRYIKPFHTFLDCEFWIARYPSISTMTVEDDPKEDKKPSIIHKLNGWQYTSKGRVDGISGNVDLSIRYEQKNASSGTKYTVGKNYTIQNNMYVRQSPEGEKVKFQNLTADAQGKANKDAEGNGILKKGTAVTCKGTEKHNGAIWMKIPSGYVCAVSTSGTIYIK